jgi:hypothetical protein
VAFTKVLTMYQIYHTLIHPVHCSPLSLPPWIPETVSAGISFAFTYTCTHYLQCIPFLLLLPAASPFSKVIF